MNTSHDFLSIWVVVKIRVPYYIGDLKVDPNFRELPIWAVAVSLGDGTGFCTRTQRP